MEESEFRAVMKHFYWKGLKPKEINDDFNENHGTSASLFALTVGLMSLIVTVYLRNMNLALDDQWK